jgi:hypothetical protein
LPIASPILFLNPERDPAGDDCRDGAARINLLDDPPQPVSAAADGRKDRRPAKPGTDKPQHACSENAVHDAAAKPCQMPDMMGLRTLCRERRRRELTVGGPDELAALMKSDLDKWDGRREVGHGERAIDGHAAK